MLLAIDTATRSVSLALHDGSEVLAEMTWRTADHHTVELTPALHQVMARSGVGPGDLAALAVTLGPGSYTGLRIGMSLAKGIALAASPPLPLIGVPTLDVVAAAQSRRADRLCAIAQAGRRRINAGFYTWEGAGWASAHDPFITTWDALLGQLDGLTQIAGEIDAQGAALLAGVPGKAIVSSPAASLRRAGFLAELALARLRAGEPADAAALAPVYLS